MAFSKQGLGTSIWVGVIGVVSAMVIGCASARNIRIEPGMGGEVALYPNNTAGAREKADELFRANCGRKKVKITSEGETIVGKVSSTRAKSEASDKSANGGQGFAHSSETTEMNQTEWRIQYKCVD